MQVFSTDPQEGKSTDEKSIPACFSYDEAAAKKIRPEQRSVIFMSPEEIRIEKKHFTFPAYATRECTNDILQSPKVEVLDGLIYGVLNRLEAKDGAIYPREITFFLCRAGLAIVSEKHEFIDSFMEYFLLDKEDERFSQILPERTLFLLLEKIVAADMALLRDMDEEETRLEEKLLADEKQDYPELIFRLRQKTLLVTQYAGLMVDLSTILEENENDLLMPDTLRMFHLIDARVARLERSAATLRESVMQLREAYQSQVDISVNQLMRLFTVVSTIFLPLTLLTSWFGMNFKFMPELSYRFAYPVVVVVSIFITVFIVWFFRKKNYL